MTNTDRRVSVNSPSDGIAPAAYCRAYLGGFGEWINNQRCQETTMLGAWLAKRKTRAAFDALNRHDLSALVRNYADDVIFVYPGEVGPHGTHEGKPAVRTLLQRVFNQYPHIRFKAKQVAVANEFDSRLLMAIQTARGSNPPASRSTFDHPFETSRVAGVVVIRS